MRELITKECSYHVSKECLIELKDFIENMVREIAIEAIKELDELNRRRKMQGLRELKRLNVDIMKKAIDNVFNSYMDVYMGLRSCGDACPGGKECQKIPPKSAVEVQ
ncbi:MAG: hypothetical protein J7K23_04145 [Thermoproteales archaeon]|nr:hypothetical protein [Thermoproteales archaeon]